MERLHWLQSALDLGEATVEPVLSDSFSCPDDEVGHGLVSEAMLAAALVAGGLPSSLDQKLASEPLFDSRPDVAAVLGLPAVAQWRVDPRVWVFSDLPAPERFVGVAGRSTGLQGSTFVLAAVDGSASALVCLEAGRFAIGVTDDRVEVVRVSAPPEEAKLEVVPPDAAELSADRILPPLDLQVSDEAPEWLREKVTQWLSSSIPLDRVAGAGALARLEAGIVAMKGGSAHARDVSDEELVDSLLARRADGVNARVRAWAQRFDGTAVRAVALSLVHEAHELSDALSALPSSLLSDPEAGGVGARSLCWRRDSLESARLVLHAAVQEAADRDLGELLNTVDNVLEGVDVHASTLLTVLDDALAGEAEDPWFEAVAWQEPDAWWGTVG